MFVKNLVTGGAATFATCLDAIEAAEKAGLFGHGKTFEKGRYTADYMTTAWGEAYFLYRYQRRPDANYDPVANGNMAWDLYREMWGSHGEFIIDGNLKSVEYAGRLKTIAVPTLITAGDHDECDPALAPNDVRRSAWDVSQGCRRFSAVVMLVTRHCHRPPDVIFTGDGAA